MSLVGWRFIVNHPLSFPCWELFSLIDPSLQSKCGIHESRPLPLRLVAPIKGCPLWRMAIRVGQYVANRGRSVTPLGHCANDKPGQCQCVRSREPEPSAVYSKCKRATIIARVLHSTASCTTCYGEYERDSIPVSRGSSVRVTAMVHYCVVVSSSSFYCALAKPFLRVIMTLVQPFGVCLLFLPRCFWNPRPSAPLTFFIWHLTRHDIM